jgi:hypothetical protein
MKRIEHTVFAEPESAKIRSPFWALIFPPTDREGKRERTRRQAEAFINESGAQNIVSVTEHAPMLGPFSVVVWWSHEVPDSDTPVIRASAQNQKA